MKFFKSLILFVVIFAFLSIAALAQDAGGVKGKVRTTRGEGISGVVITVRQNGEDIKSAVSTGGGKFVLDNLKTGVYNVVFSKNGYSSGLMYNVEVKKKKVSDLGDRLVLTVDQGTQIIIKGSVFDQNGRSVYGAKVEIEKISDGRQTLKVGSGYTSQSGEFTFRQTEGAAKFRVTASIKGASGNKEVEVTSAAIYRLAITLKSEQ